LFEVSGGKKRRLEGKNIFVKPRESYQGGSVPVTGRQSHWETKALEEGNSLGANLKVPLAVVVCGGSRRETRDDSDVQRGKKTQKARRGKKGGKGDKSIGEGGKTSKI